MDATAAGAPRTAGDPEAGAPDEALVAMVHDLRARVGVDAAMGVRVTGRGQDTAVEVAIETHRGLRHERRLAFLRGTMGRHRAAITAAALLLANLPDRPEASR